MRLTLASVMLLILGGTLPSSAREIYVNNRTGDDASGGQSPESGVGDGPVRTIGRALALAGFGDRIVLADAGMPYREALCLSGRHRGSPRHPFVVAGGGAVLDGTVVAPPGAWQHARGELFAMRPRRLAYQQLFRDGEPLRSVRVAAWSEGTPQLKPLEWALHQGQILLRVEKGKLPQDYALRHAGLQTGISLYNTAHIRIQDLVVQGFQQDGINAHDTVRDCQITHVESRANGRCGMTAGGSSRVELRRCNLYDNGRAELRLEDVARVAVFDTEIDESGAVPVEINGGQLSVDGGLYGALKETLDEQTSYR